MPIVYGAINLLRVDLLSLLIYLALLFGTWRFVSSRARGHEAPR